MLEITVLEIQSIVFDISYRRMSSEIAIDLTREEIAPTPAPTLVRYAHKPIEKICFNT
jgi:hypothetical protein